MLRSPNPQELEAFAVLDGNRATAMFLAFLADNEALLTEHLLGEVDPPKMYQRQAAIRVLRDIRLHVTGARQQLTNLAKGKS